MKITHIYHSGFSIELQHSTLLFDYYEGQLPAFDPHRKSHEHHDHYDPVIWTLKGRYPKIYYILDEDVAPDAVRIFMEEVGCRNLFPMHYWDRQDEIRHWVETGCLREWKDKIHFEDVMEI